MFKLVMNMSIFFIINDNTTINFTRLYVKLFNPNKILNFILSYDIYYR